MPMCESGIAEKRPPGRPTRFFYGMFSVIFLLLTGLSLSVSMFSGGNGVAHTIATVLCTAAALAGFAVFYRMLRLCEFTNRTLAIFTVCAFVLLFTGGTVLAYFLRFEPAWDLEAIYRGAEQWVLTGDFTGYSSKHCHADYFYIFPNNFGAMFLLYLWFRLFYLFGAENFYFAAVLLNMLLVSLTMVVSSRIAGRLFGKRGAVLLLCLFLFSPFWFCGAVFYTDTLSMFFPVASAALFIEAKGRKPGMSAALCTAGAILLAVGGAVKATVLILLPAGIITLALRRDWRRLAAFTLICTVSIISVNFIVGTIRGRHLDPRKIEEERMPVTYWLALGCTGNGEYSNEIFSSARSAGSSDERRAAMKEQIVNSVKEAGAGGTARLFLKKAGGAFPDGTYAFSDFLDDSPASPSALHKFLLPGGKGYPVYSAIANSIFFAVMLLSLFSVRRQIENQRVFVFQLCISGIILFFTVWESNGGRSSVNFIPFFMICAAGGLENITGMKFFAPNNLRDTRHSTTAVV